MMEGLIDSLREREKNGFNLCRKRKPTRATRLIKYLWLAFIDAWVDRVACGGSILARVSLGNTPSSPFKFDGWRTFLAGYFMGIWFCNWAGPVHGPGSGPATCEFRKIRCEACYKAMVILLMEELSLSSAQIK
jgi:hypothetical protein